MKPSLVIRHEFVDFIPETLEERTLYVSITYATVVHRCFCGCGSEVVTPLSPTDWQLTFDGKTVSLSPSIGSWSLSCRSHYWIRRDRVEWAAQWSDRQIEAARMQDRREKLEYFGEPAGRTEAQASVKRPPWWQRFKRQRR